MSNKWQDLSGRPNNVSLFFQPDPGNQSLVSCWKMFSYLKICSHESWYCTRLWQNSGTRYFVHFWRQMASRTSWCLVEVVSCSGTGILTCPPSSWCSSTDLSTLRYEVTLSGLSMMMITGPDSLELLWHRHPDMSSKFLVFTHWSSHPPSPVHWWEDEGSQVLAWSCLFCDLSADVRSASRASSFSRPGMQE